jgi:hypothetical protein
MRITSATLFEQTGAVKQGPAPVRKAIGGND